MDEEHWSYIESLGLAKLPGEELPFPLGERIFDFKESYWSSFIHKQSSLTHFDDGGGDGGGGDDDDDDDADAACLKSSDQTSNGSVSKS